MLPVKFGFHINIAGGFDKAALRAEELECKTIQIFSRNPRGWNYPPLKKEGIEEFKMKIKNLKISPVVIHMPYLPNPASPDKTMYKKSIDSIITEIERAEILNAEYVNIHIGKKMESSLDEAIERVIEGINYSIEKTPESKVIILLENTAGQGSEIGNKFEQIKDIINEIKDKSRIGVCLDTAHLFQAGYDLRDKNSIKNTFNEFDKIVGLKYLKCIHYNDSNTELGSAVDRHWHIGEGCIGKDGMKYIITYKKLSHLPFIMETPKKSETDDLNNLKVVKEFLSKNNFWE